MARGRPTRRCRGLATLLHVYKSLPGLIWKDPVSALTSCLGTGSAPPHSPASRATGRVKLWKRGVLLHSFPQHSFPATFETERPYSPVLLPFLFASHTSYLQSMVHLTNKETEAQSSEEILPWSCPVSRQPSGSSDLWPSLLPPRLRLMANPHSSLGSG